MHEQAGIKISGTSVQLKKIKWIKQVLSGKEKQNTITNIYLGLGGTKLRLPGF